MAISEQAILDYIADHPGARREEIRRQTAPNVSSPTIWRALKRLVVKGKLEVSGKGRGTGYSVAGATVVRAHLVEPHNRRTPASYNRDFIDRYVPDTSFYLNSEDRQRLRDVGTPLMPLLPAGTYARRVLERLLVDLSWASSRMEGNTYSILDTERLIRFGEEVSGKDRKEAVMILNHKEAIQYIVDNLELISISKTSLTNIHALLSDGLLANPVMAGRLRRMPVGITSSSYRPPEDHIEEEFEVLMNKAAAITDPFEQSFFLLVHLPYLQPFDDINKRTSRVASNIPLLKSGVAPMSFLTMDDGDYLNGLTGIYELNNVSLLRDVYMDAYMASARNYRVLRAQLETPEKPALVYREFVREAVRRSVLNWRAFDAARVAAMAAQAGIPEEDRDQVVDYVGQEFGALHEGNIIRYRLQPADLKAIFSRSGCLMAAPIVGGIVSREVPDTLFWFRPYPT